MSILYAEAALRDALMKRRPEKYVANPRENTHTKVRPQQIHRINIHPPTRAHLKDCIHAY